jgi:uncharacterized protein (TIGR01777 family)
MRIFITGATGLIGRRLVVDRLERGDQVVVVSRNGRRAEELFAAHVNPNVVVVPGNPAAPGAWQSKVDGCDAVIHLAGAGIADRRWTEAYKKLLVDSRVDSTYQLVTAIQTAGQRPGMLLCASAVGLYGDTGSDTVDEAREPGEGFLADLACRWETQAERAAELGTRVNTLRIGLVLDRRGGALARMIPAFRLGLGGPLGNGRQYVSWIHHHDLIRLIDHLLVAARAPGPYNATAPNPVTSRQLARALGGELRRPAVLPAPRFALRVALGEMSEALLMSSRVVPSRAQREGFRFLYPRLDDALRSLLRPATSEGAREETGATREEGQLQPPGRLEVPAETVRLLAISVGGTLLRSDGSLSQGVIQACRMAERTGCVIVLATSRSPRAVQSVLQALDVVSPLIAYNGAVIWNPLDDRAQHHQPLDAALAREIIEVARTLHPEILVALEVLDRCYTDRLDRRAARQAGLTLEPDDIGPLDRHLQQPVSKLDLAGPPEHIAEVAARLRELFWRQRRIAMFQPGARVVQITHPLVDKGIALQRIAARMGVGKSQVMAIGSAENDLGMLEWAGFSVAVENATPAALRIVDRTVPSNDQQGVARAIHRFVLQRRPEAVRQGPPTTGDVL